MWSLIHLRVRGVVRARDCIHIKFSHKKVLQLAWPIILSNLSIPLVGVVDTAVVGQLSHPRYMAAVAVGAIIFSSVFWVFGFLRMGTTGFVSQAYGRNNSQQVSLAFLRALLIALLLAFIVIGLQQPIRWLAFSLMDANPEVTATAESYYAIRIWSAPATFINYCILGTLIGLQRMRLALFTQLVLNGTNILLNLYFVLVLKMDVEGVALSSAISDYLAAGFGLWLLREYIRPLLVSPNATIQRVMQRSELLALFRVNGNLFIRTLFLTSAFFFFTAQSAKFGTVVLAANAILINMLQMLAYGLDGFAQAAEALVGGAYGKRDRKAFSLAVRSSMLWAGIAAVLIAGLYALFGSTIIRLMTGIEAVILIAESYLPWLIAAPVLAVWSYQFDGIFIGATQTTIMRNTVGIALGIYIIVALLSMPYWGNHALWASMMLFLLLRGVSLALYYPKLVSSI